MTQAKPKRPPAQIWRPEVPPENTAPAPSAPAPKPEDWGVTVDEARAMLERQMCPVCGNGPWKSPLNHVARKHGIDRMTMRDICHMSTRDKVTDAEFRARCEERGRQTLTPELAGRISEGVDRRKARRTHAAQRGAENLQRWIDENPEEAARLRAEFRDRMASPEARARWEASMERVRAEREYTDEEKAAFRDRMSRADVVSKRRAALEAIRTEGCSVADCDRPHVANGMCKLHYRRVRNGGEVGQARPLTPSEGARLPRPNRRALTNEQMEQVREACRKGESQSAVGARFGVTQSIVSRVVRGEYR